MWKKGADGLFIDTSRRGRSGASTGISVGRAGSRETAKYTEACVAAANAIPPSLACLVGKASRIVIISPDLSGKARPLHAS